MARDDLHFRLRIPEDLKKQIAASARANDRSLTAEIVARLQSSYDASGVDPSDAEMVDIVADFDRLKKRVIASRQK